MKYKQKNIQLEEIDFGQIVKNLWNEKILILAVSIFFLVIGYVYSSSKEKEFETKIVIRFVPVTSFANYDRILNINEYSTNSSKLNDNTFETGKLNFAKLFNEEFNQNILSIDNLNEFVLKNNNISLFKSFLKEKQNSAKNYFQNSGSKKRLGNILRNKKIVANEFYLNFPKELNGDIFLNEYIIFSFQKAEKSIKSIMISLISNEILKNENNILIADELNINEPLSVLEFSDKTLLFLDSKESSYRSGKKILTKEIAFYRNLIEQIKNEKLNHNPILDGASLPIIVSDSPTKFAVLTFIAGFFLSLIIIMIKNVFRSN